uniref:ZCF37 n=1 Tax=Salix viminalis TaxID=40686 RepID=A0A6N2MH24_SALVM
MLNSFICGNFQNQELEGETWNSPSSTPKRSSPSATPKRSSPSATPRRSRKNSKNNKNPYSSRGLDKFSALLAELEEKRQKIYTQIGPDDVSMVRFVYSSSNDCIPVIVKVKDQKQDKPKLSCADDHIKKTPIDHSSEAKLPLQAPAETKQVEQTRLETDKKKTQKNCFPWSIKMQRWRRPYYYMPVAIVLILLLLVFFGRSAAILWTSLGWYTVPTLSTKKPTKEKDVRRLSEPKMVINHGVSSRKRNSTGKMTDRLPDPQRGQRKSF